MTLPEKTAKDTCIHIRPIRGLSNSRQSELTNWSNISMAALPIKRKQDRSDDTKLKVCR